MGKRKLHGTTFFQCDWTGFPMKSTNCFLPSWHGNDKDTGKMTKKGFYCNWESVLAHAQFLCVPDDEASCKWLRDVTEFVHEQTGAVYLQQAPHFNDLAHIKGSMTMQQFHDTCCAHMGPIPAVKITQTGEIIDFHLQPVNGKICIKDYLHKSYNDTEEISTFRSTRKARASNNRDLTVFYYNSKALPLNQMATNVFKMQLYGDMVLTQISKEASFLPRDRYIPYTKSNFEEQFTRKKKRVSETDALDMQGYACVHQEMQQDFKAIERDLTKDAIHPFGHGRLLKLPRIDGRKLGAQTFAAKNSRHDTN